MPDAGGEKTHDATPHRRQQAREKGQVAFSQDLGSAALLLAGGGLLLVIGPGVIRRCLDILRAQLGDLGPMSVNRDAMTAQGESILQELGAMLLPLMVSLAAVSLVVSVLQTGFLFSPERLTPDLSRLSLLSGLRRIVSLQGAARLGFGIFKVLVVTAVGGAVIYNRHEELLLASSLEIGLLGRFVADIALATTLWVAAALLVLALFDYAFQRWKHEQDLKMTHQEVREEMKNLQGDPQIVARRRAVQRQMALNRIGDSVPKADVVVTNPTELAVAIQYDMETMAAPIVVAKGAGVLAQRIRRLALENNVPIVERKPLAQLLYKDVDVNHPIPDESYAAVAEVLAYVYQLQGKKAPTPPPAA